MVRPSYISAGASYEWDLWGNAALRGGAYLEDGGDSRSLLAPVKGLLPELTRRTVKTVLGRPLVLNRAIDLLPADFSYRNMDLFLEHAKKPAQQLRKLLTPFRSEYYYVFLDCPPSISLASESVFVAADAVLVPTIPTTLSLRTYKQIRRFFKQQGISPEKVMSFFSMVDRRNPLRSM